MTKLEQLEKDQNEAYIDYIVERSPEAYQKLLKTRDALQEYIYNTK